MTQGTSHFRYPNKGTVSQKILEVNERIPNIADFEETLVKSITVD